LEVKN